MPRTLRKACTTPLGGKADTEDTVDRVDKADRRCHMRTPAGDREAAGDTAAAGDRRQTS